MLSRRRFLQSNFAALAIPAARSVASTDDTVQTRQAGAGPVRQYWNDWPEYMISQVSAARSRRKATLATLTSESQLHERIQMVRSKVWDNIGGPLEKSPLNPVVVGSIDMKAYRIEKVIFESQPKVYVTGNLYVPSNGSGPFPAVLSPLGHWPNGKDYRNYRYVYQTLARKGYVVLAYDPFGQGERHQYLDPRTGRSLYGPTGEHTQAGRPMLLLGASFAQYRLWDAIRAVDYLLTRPEVDRNRIGCTGHSGGGTMTMYLCALEPRIHVAVEVQGNSENLAGPSYDPPGAVADAEQNLIDSLSAGIDRGDLLLAFAPKPLMICYSVQDVGTTYSPRYAEGTQEILEELKAVYRISGDADKVQLFRSTLPHDYDFFTRRAAYEWFNRWLAKKDLGNDESAFDNSPAEELYCTTTGEVLTSLGGRSLVQLNSDRARAVIPPTPLKGAEEPQALRQRFASKLKDLLALPTERTRLDSRILSTNSGQIAVIEEIEFRSEPQIRIPGWFIKPVEGKPPFPTVLYIPEEGKDSIMEEPHLWDGMIQRGYAFCSIDLRGLGVTAPRYPSGGPLFYGYGDPDTRGAYAWAGLILGKPVTGQCVWDFLRCLDYLETREEIDRSRIFVMGVGGAGLTTLLGTVVDGRPCSLLLHRTIADLRSVVESPVYSLQMPWFVFGLLKYFDLPDLVGALAPKPCWFLNATGPQEDRLAESVLNDRFNSALGYYEKNGGAQRLKFIVQPDEGRSRALLSWLEST
jgi:cephalosporin-C deacetylase-like acetyl esterase